VSALSAISRIDAANVVNEVHVLEFILSRSRSRDLMAKAIKVSVSVSVSRPKNVLITTLSGYPWRLASRLDPYTEEFQKYFMNVHSNITTFRFYHLLV